MDQDKIDAHFEKGKKGVLEFLAGSGGMLPMSELHDYSEKTFFIGHQRFSEMMEFFVAEDLLEYDNGQVTLSAKGRDWI